MRSHRLRRSPVLAVLSALVVLPFAGCSGDDEADAGTTPAFGGSLGEALAAAPAETTAFAFLDNAAVLERTGVSDLGPDASVEDRIDLLLKASNVSSEPLVAYSTAMQDAAFDGFDVQWRLDLRTTSEVGVGTSPISVLRLVDDVDLDTVAADLLDAGYVEDEVGGLPHYAADIQAADDTGLTGGRYPIELGDVTIADDHLLVVGFAPPPEATEAVLATIADDAASASDGAGFADLLVGADGAELVRATQQGVDGTCATASDALGQVPAAEVDRVIEEAGVAELASPEREVGLIDAEGTPSARLLFADAETAESDAEARTTYLAEGLSLLSQAPASDVVEVEDVGVEGAVETLQLTFPGGIRTFDEMLGRDLVFACGP